MRFYNSGKQCIRYRLYSKRSRTCELNRQAQPQHDKQTVRSAHILLHTYEHSQHLPMQTEICGLSSCPCNRVLIAPYPPSPLAAIPSLQGDAIDIGARQWSMAALAISIPESSLCSKSVSSASWQGVLFSGGVRDAYRGLVYPMPGTRLIHMYLEPSMSPMQRASSGWRPGDTITASLGASSHSAIVVESPASRRRVVLTPRNHRRVL